MEDRYARGCALVTEGAGCTQCLQLDQHFRAHQGDPLAGTTKDLRARLRILRDERAQPLGPWHSELMQLVRDLID